MLVEMLKQSDNFKNLPAPKQQIMLKLAHTFEKSTSNLFYNHEELSQLLQTGTKEQWYEFLNLQEVQNYIKTQMAFIAQISQRKTFHSLVQMALDGNQQAAKQVQELSGILNSQDNNKVVVLHFVPRPKQEEVS